MPGGVSLPGLAARNGRHADQFAGAIDIGVLVFEADDHFEIALGRGVGRPPEAAGLQILAVDRVGGVVTRFGDGGGSGHQCGWALVRPE